MVDAALQGFYLAARRPWLILVWALVPLAAFLVQDALVALLLGADHALVASATDDPMAGYTGVRPAYLRVQALELVVGLVFASVLVSAVMRAVLHPEQARFAYLRLGAAELRMGALLVLYAVVLALIAAVFLLSVLLAAGVAMATGVGVKGSAAIPPIALAILALAFWVLSRLSLAAPMSFEGPRPRLLAAWRQTRGRGRRLAACSALSGLFALTLFMMIIPATVWAAGQPGHLGAYMVWAKVLRPDLASLESYLTPELAIFLAGFSVFSAMTLAVLLAPLAALWRDLQGPQAEEAPA